MKAEPGPKGRRLAAYPEADGAEPGQDINPSTQHRSDAAERPRSRPLAGDLDSFVLAVERTCVALAVNVPRCFDGEVAHHWLEHQGD
jgi:hypothetical protein